MARTPRPVDLPLDPRVGAEGSVTERLTAQLREAVTTGTLRPGDHLPSTRSLAVRLGVSRGSVVTAYEQLTAEGYVEAVRGSGTRVTPALTSHLASPRPRSADRSPRAAGGAGEPAGALRGAARRRATTGPTVPHPIDLRPGGVDVSPLVTPAWRSAWREAAAHPRRSAPPADGDPALRAAIAERLRRVRGCSVDPAAPVVTAGARHGLSLLLTALATRRGRPLVVAFESPGSPGLRQVPALLGHRTVDAPVDTDGLDPAQVPAGIDVLVVTPSHQFPLGADLPLARRLAVLELARERDVLVVEDEHTAEWRWSGAPLPALAGLDDPRDPRVALLGTVSSQLGPGSALGHVVPPAPMRDAVTASQSALGSPVDAVVQDAAARFLTGGGFDRHLQRLRTAHRKRLEILQHTLAEVPGVELQPVPGGLAAVALTALPEEKAVARARAAGVLVTGLHGYWGGPTGRDGVLIGFGGPTRELQLGLSRLVEALRTAPSRDQRP
ncbi:PLP-dependent aminotransferase family protein [Brachybacterium sp. EF45031]|uniref:MocR-like pyridoxine biosynthesis transcription factor PdxR n=1 Tax=Brachybacterium sillae TaxID=2810536 RepID=UPI00217F0697|nr:PLP-dependent aminotransferase family protein [Brachybacterium sillae]MCS6711544.1 PLP-dependent aminotransferase family protein [Brachybacterium sillae]